jgi:hypothetical protein
MSSALNEFNDLFAAVTKLSTTDTNNVFGSISMVSSLVHCLREFESDTDILQSLLIAIRIISRIGKEPR